jgi:hypothetical protein
LAGIERSRVFGKDVIGFGTGNVESLELLRGDQPAIADVAPV